MKTFHSKKHRSKFIIKNLKKGLVMYELKNGRYIRLIN